MAETGGINGAMRSSAISSGQAESGGILGAHGPIATTLRKFLTLNGLIADQDANGSGVDACNIKDLGVIFSRFARTQGGEVSEAQKGVCTAWQLLFTGIQEIAKSPHGAAWLRGVDYTKGLEKTDQIPLDNLTVAEAAAQGAATGRLAVFFAALQKCATLNYHITPRDTHSVIGSLLCIPLWAFGAVSLIKADKAKKYLPFGTKFTKASFFAENGIGALQRFTGGGFMREFERGNYSFLSARPQNRGFLTWRELWDALKAGGVPGPVTQGAAAGGIWGMSLNPSPSGAF